MSHTIFGVVGGYGATGREVAAELWKSCVGEILIGGRDLGKAQAVAARFDHRASATQLDVLDSRSLDDFCSRCSIIVNCAGPTTVLQDRVAQAAFRRRCHYVDPGGFSFLKQRLLPNSREIADLGLSFVLSAGWVPGMTEVLPVYADAQARTRMDEVESVSMYFGDSSEWSASALRDGVWYLRQLGLRSPRYFRKGERIRANTSLAYRKVDLGTRIGLGRFYMFSTPELDEVGRRLTGCDFLSYGYLAGSRAVIAGTLVALLPLPEQIGVRLIRSVFRSTLLPVGGFVVVHAVGRLEGRSQTFLVQTVYDEHRQYWANGVVPAIAARMISADKGTQAGVHFLPDAVDPVAFVTELRKAGVEQTEKFEPRE